MHSRWLPFAICCGLTAACTPAKPGYEDLPGISNVTNPSAGGGVDAQGNLTGQAAVTPGAYANPWNISITQEPNVFNSASSEGYVYAAPGGNLLLYGATGRPRTTDVMQVLGNSAFMGALATVTDRLPAFVHTGIRYIGTNSDGSHSYLLRLYGPTPNDANYTELWIPTDDRLLTKADGGLFGASGNVLWAALYQKAYAKLDAVTHQDIGDTTVTGYDTQNFSGHGSGLAALTGLDVAVYTNTGARDANSQTLRDGFNVLLGGVNAASNLMGCYMLTASDLATFPEYNTGSASATLDSGAKLTASTNAPNLSYAPTGGPTVELIANMEYSVLATYQAQVLIRNTWGIDGSAANGYIWLPRADFLRVFSAAAVVTNKGSALGAAALPDTP